MTGRVYVVAVSHLDTQWRWTVRDTIRRHLPKTVRENVAAFARHPGYVVSFDGAFRYALLKEYDPAAFEEVRRHVAAGRWVPAGAFWDAADVNIPSPESLIRQVLYGSGFFERELGRRPREIFLPDCFGFGWALPSIAAHCGLTSFSSQKLSRGRAAGEIPFDLGIWTGPDGQELLAALPLYGYGKKWPAAFPDPETLGALDRQEARSGLRRIVSYYGVGDTGGALDDASIAGLEGAAARADPEVVLDGPGRWAEDLTAAERARLPHHSGELLLGVHGTGCYTAQAAMKRWNRKNEQLADAAERAASAAHALGALPYPREALREAWQRFLWHQFHDDLTGTSVPAAYDISWNDEALALNQFGDVLEAAVAAVAAQLDTRTSGLPILVFNPLAIEREDLVEARLRFDAPAPAAVRVFGPGGAEVAAQTRAGPEGHVELVFLARLAPLEFAVFDARPGGQTCALETGLSADPAALGNGRYRARLDASGDLSSLFDVAAGREWLSAPHRLELLPDRSARFPAWEILPEDVATAAEVVAGPAQVRVAEAGPARVCLELERRVGRSVFLQRLRLAAGAAGDRLEISTAIDWRCRGRLLKARFSCRLDDPVATYDLGLGRIERGVNTERLYEVPAQQWACLSDRATGEGLAILNDCKYGWDRPAADTLRLTLLHTPRAGRRFRDQRRLDLGRNGVLYALSGHARDALSGAPEQAARLNQPLRAFQTPRHPGRFGRRWSLLASPPGGASLASLKVAEASEELVARVLETRGTSSSVELAFSRPIVAAREVNGAEEPVSLEVRREAGRLQTALPAFGARAFAVRLAPPDGTPTLARSTPLSLPFDRAVVSFESDFRGGDFDGRGRSLPGELLPQELMWSGIRFALGPREGGAANALVCRGQRLELPSRAGSCQLALLAASAGGDAVGTLAVDGAPLEIRIPDWAAPLGRADRRSWGRLEKGFLRREHVAWVATHRHGPGGVEPYVFCYLFAIRVDLPDAARAITLPTAPSARLLAATLVESSSGPTPLLQPLDF